MKKLLLAAGVFASLQMSSQIWSENFNGGTTLPAGWSQETSASDGGWSVNTPTGLSSTSFAIPAADGNIIGTNDDDCDCDKSNDFLMLPAFDLTGVASPYLQFNIFYYQGTYDATEDLTVEVSTDGTNWTVLQSIAGAADWHMEAISLVDYAGQNNVQVGFRYNDGGGWLFGVGMDDFELFEPDLSVIDAIVADQGVGVYVADVPGTYYTFSKYINGMEVNPAVVVANNAFAEITSFDVSYTVNGNTVTESVSGVNLGFGGSYLHEFAQGFTMTSGANDFSFSISNVNGGAETVTNNNTGGTTSMEGITPFDGRIVVAEEGTGTWCGWCPRGTVFMDYLANKYPSNFMGIAVHNGDPMTVTDYDASMANNISGYPSGLVDRADFAGSGEVDPQDFEAAMMERIATDPGVQVETNVQYLGTGTYVTSNLTFTQAMSGQYRIAVVLVEDGVTGTGSTWGQTNYYSGGGNGPMGGFEDLGPTVPAADMEYNHVARILLGGWGGFANSVPANPAAGSTVSYTVYTELEDSWDVFNLHAITLLIKTSTGEIVNAGVSGDIATSVVEAAAPVAFNVYPNPANDQAFIRLSNTNPTDVTVTIFDSMGKVVATQVYNNLNNENLIPVNTSAYANGLYTVTVAGAGEVATRTLVVNR